MIIRKIIGPGSGHGVSPAAGMLVASLWARVRSAELIGRIVTDAAERIDRSVPVSKGGSCPLVHSGGDWALCRQIRRLLEPHSGPFRTELTAGARPVETRAEQFQVPTTKENGK